jgi:non-ribosomal peptide synthase protein (TIGR01720 family)
VHPDTSRTIGRLSTRYPVEVRHAPGEDAMACVPAGGDNYDLLTYLNPVPDADLAAAGSRVLFNYLGRVDALWRTLPLMPSELMPDMKHGGSADRYQLEFMAGMDGGQLIVSCAYCPDCFEDATVAALLGEVRRDLEEEPQPVCDKRRAA